MKIHGIFIYAYLLLTFRTWYLTIITDSYYLNQWMILYFECIFQSSTADWLLLSRHFFALTLRKMWRPSSLPSCIFHLDLQLSSPLVLYFIDSTCLSKFKCIFIFLIFLARGSFGALCFKMAQNHFQFPVISIMNVFVLTVSTAKGRKFAYPCIYFGRINYGY